MYLFDILDVDSDKKLNLIPMSRKSNSFLNLTVASLTKSPGLTDISEAELNPTRKFRRSFLPKYALLSVFTVILSSAMVFGQTTFTASTTGDWTTISWAKTGSSLALYPGQPGYEAEVHHVVINGAGITVNLNTNIISSVRNVTITSGTLNISSNTLTMAGNLSGAGTISFTSGTLNIAGSNTMTGTFNAGTGTVNFNGTGGQTIKAASYYNLGTSGSGTKVLQGRNNHKRQPCCFRNINPPY